MRKRGCSFYRLCLFLLAIVGGFASGERKLYVSRSAGNDVWSCDQSMPCKSILRAIRLASRGDHIYLDGTNTDRHPYNCTGQTGISEYPGIYVNKSLSLIGYNSPMPQIRCPDGAGLTFNGADDAEQMNVTLSRLFVNESFVTFLDSSAKISGCTFEGSKLGVRFLMRQKLVFGIDITNSTFSASGQCVSVHIKDAKTTSEPIQVIFNITNSLFEGNVLLDGACISFTKTAFGYPYVSCNKTFKNVTFVHNRFGSKGLVFVEMGYGSQNINFHNVTFTENSPSSGHNILTGEGHSEYIVRSTTVHISIDSSKFKSQTARLFNISAASISLQIYNSNFCGHNVEGKGGVVSLSGTDCQLKVCNSSFVNTTAAQGGTFNIECTKLQSGSFLDSNFLNNTARGSGGAVYIHSLGSTSNDTKHTTRAKSNFNSQSVSVGDQSPNISITKCDFKNAISFCAGGAVHINLPRALVRLRESNFTNCTSVPYCTAVGKTMEKRHRGGGAVYIMSALMTPASHLVLVLESSSFVRCSSPINATGGALIVIYEKKLMISINHTRFICNQALYGGAIGILYLKRSQIGRGEERNYITIENSNFSNNSALVNGGGICLEANTRSTFILEKVIMDSNHGGKRGGAVSVYFIFNLTLHKSNFSRNMADHGGALDLSYVKKLVVQDSLFKGNYALQSEQFGDYGGGAILVSIERLASCASENSKSDLLFKDARFEENAATTGGAVCLLNSNATFQNCSFVDNFAVNQGAHVYTSIGYGSLIFQDSSLSQNELQPFKGNFSTASLLYADSPGALKLYNTTVDLRTYCTLNPMMLVTNGRHIDGNNNLTRFFCPRGSQIEITNISTAVCYDPGFEFQTTSSVQVRCAACMNNSYSLQRGSALRYHATPGFRCLPCPFGANCAQNVLAKPNFWGFEENTTPPSLKFIMCPPGYCSQPPKPGASEYNACQGNRSGTLCGACKEPFTETLYSTNCRLSHECKDYWFWPVALLYVSIMALYFTFKPPIVPWIKHQITWFRKNEPAADCDNDFDDGYLKIIFYFYQAANLILVNKSSLTVVNTKFIQPLVGLFNFHQEFSPSGLICPFPGLTVVTKHLFIASHVFGTLLMVGIFYIFHWGVQKLRGQEAPSVGPYFGGVLQTMLLGYTTLATVTFNLVRCVSIGPLEQRLFYDGTVVCYGWRQYVFIAFNCAFFVPFLLILLWGSFKLHKKTVSAGMFLLACCFPLPFLLYWAYMSFIRGARNGAIGDTPSSQLSRNSVESVLYDPFKRPENGKKLSLSWESVMIGRRLILVVLKTFVSDPMPRLLLMSFLCFLFLLHHALTQPFRDDIANAAETISLLFIGLLGMVNIFFAAFLSLAVSPLNDHFSSWQNACQVVEIIILCAAPAIFALLVVVFAMSQVVRLSFKICCILHHLYVACFSWCGGRKDHEMSPLLAPSS